MSTITTPAPKTTKTTKTTDAYPGAIPPEQAANVHITPAALPDVTLQEAMSGAAPVAPLNDTTKAPAPSADTEQAVSLLLDQLGSLIGEHGKVLVGVFAARGAIVRDIIDVKLTPARNAQQRRDYRADGIRAAELRALSVVDRKSESKPDPDRWLTLQWLVDLCPLAKDLPSVVVALRIAHTCIERETIPTAFNSRESWRVRAGFVDRLDEIVKRTIDGHLSADKIGQLLDEMAGIVVDGAPSARDAKDPVKSAESAAKSLLNRLRSGEVDPDTYFDALAPWLGKFGWTKASRE